MPASTNKALLFSHINPHSSISESYRALRTNIQFCSIPRAVHSILVTSAEIGEGKTSTVSNLAVVYAQEKKKVLMIDANLRNPRLHHVYAKSNRAGLSNLLCDMCSLEEVIEPTHIDNLSILTSGPVPPNPADVLASVRMTPVLEQIRARFDVILVDSPATSSVTDAQLLAANCDGVVLVVRAGKTKRLQVRKAIGTLGHVKANLLGIVLNRIK